MNSLPEYEAKVVSTTSLLNDGGSWTDRSKAKEKYDELKSLDSRLVVNSMVLQIINGGSSRLKTLILAMKLGIPDSEHKLGKVLMIYGDKWMAEDYLNSGSSILDSYGVQWARAHGYDIRSGQGSHRAGWGRF